MKITSLVMILSVCALSGTRAALPSFSEKLHDRPELSLSEAIKAGQLPKLDPEAKARAERLLRTSTEQKRLVSRMPVIEPSADVGQNMPLIAPKADTDYRMIVKEPAVDTMK
jgi:hypothetical protein